MKRKIATYDVFAKSSFDGNQAAVVHQGQGLLSNQQLLALAREFSLAETVAFSRRGKELVFRFANTDHVISACGHGILAGVAHHVFWKVPQASRRKDKWNGTYRIGSAVAEWHASPIRSSHSLHNRFPGIEVSVSWPRRPQYVKSIPAHSVYRALGLVPSDRRPDLPLCVYDCGNLNALVPVRTSHDLKRATPNWPLLKTLFSKYGLTDLHMYSLVRRHWSSRRVHLRSRNLFPYGIFEEVATGTASISLAAALIDHIPALHSSDKPIDFLFDQGIGKRRGMIRVSWRPGRKGAPTIWLKGWVFPVIRGHLISTPLG